MGCEIELRRLAHASRVSGERVLAIANFPWGSFPVADDEIKGKIISARRRNQRARRVRYPERRLARAFSARCL